ncbi:MAG: aminotransferase class IV [Pseudomonadota bacterium]
MAGWWPKKDAKISVLDHGLLYGDGLFEGIRVRAGRIFRLDQHLTRLALGARSLGLELPFDGEGQARIVRETVRAFGRKEAYVRLLVTRVKGPWASTLRLAKSRWWCASWPRLACTAPSNERRA